MRISVSLGALRAFEAVARLGTVRAAAMDLGVTASAVGHQLRGLEEALGVPLLRRASGGSELTETGRRLAPELTAGFARIAAAVEEAGTARRGGPLKVSMLPTFLSHWLSPRLAGYPFARPGFAILIATSQALVDLEAGEADAAIRFGAGAWPGVAADLLFGEHLDLFAPPALADGNATLLGNATLFLSQHRREAFATWAAALPAGTVPPGIVIVESTGTAIKAAADGAGLAFAGVEMAASEVAAGRLVAPLARPMAVAGGYHLVYRPPLARDRRLRNLRDWLRGEVRAAGIAARPAAVAAAN